MNKNLNGVLFVLGATAFNLVLTLVIWLAGSAATIALGNLAFGETFAGRFAIPITVIWFIASIVLTFLVYGRLTKWLQAKHNLEQFLPQWFAKRR